MNKKIWIGGTAASLVVLYTAVGFWVIPSSTNWALKKYVSPLIDREVVTEDVSFNPYTLQLNVKGLTVTKNGETEPLVTVKELDTKLSWASLFKLSPLVDHFTIDGFQGNIVRTGLTRFSFSDIIDKFTQEDATDTADAKDKKDDKPFLFAVDNVHITNSGIHLDDKFRNKVDDITDLEFAMPLISNFKNEVDNPITPKLSFNFNGKPLVFSANSVPFSISQKTGASFEIKDISLENLASFNPIKLNANVASGTLSANLNLAFANEDKEEAKHLRLRGTISLDDVVLQDCLNKPYDILQFKKLTLDLKNFAFFAQEIEFSDIKLESPVAIIDRTEKGINVATLSEKLVKEEDSGIAKIEEKETKPETTTASDEESKPWKWSVDKITLSDGLVHFKDNSPEFNRDLSHINITLSPLSWESGTKTATDIALNVLGASVSGNGTLVIDPMSLTLNTKVANLNLEELNPYITQFTNIQIAKGEFSNDGTITFILDSKPAKESDPGGMQLQYQGNLKLTDLAVQDTVGKPYEVLSLNSLNIDVRNFALLDQSVEVNAIELDAPKVAFTQDANSNNLTVLADNLVRKQPQQTAAESKDSSTSETKSEEKPTTAARPWNWQLDKIVLSNGQVQFTDTAANFSRAIQNINVSLAPLSSVKGSKTTVQAGLSVLGGSLSTNGTLVLDPLSLSLDTKTQGLQIAEAMPYISQFTTAKISGGQVSNQGTVSVAMAGTTTDVKYNGSVNVNSLNVTDAKGAPIAKFDALNVDGLALALGDKLSVDVGSIALKNPSAFIVKGKDGALNVAGLAKSDEGKKEESKASKSDSSSSAMPAITVGQLNVTGGNVTYIDNAMKPSFRTQVTQLKGDVKGFTTTKNSPANVSIGGLLNGTPMSAKGSINPFAKALDLNMNGEVKSLSLAAFSPFAAEYTGYPIKQGLLTFKGKYKIANESLTSENDFVINRLEFGDEVPNAKDTLPVKLAVTLLQDRSGQIDLNIPVSGSFNDPEFSVGGIIVKVIVNLISKAVTAPFALIGSVFGGENMDLNNLAFDSGRWNITADTSKALDVIAKAMADRPGLQLQIIGVATAQADSNGIRESVLNREMHRILGAAGNNRKLTADQTAQAIDKLFAASTAANKPKADTQKAKQEFLLNAIPVTDKELIDLANRRAQAVRDQLINKLKVPANRLFIVNAETDNTDKSQMNAGVRLGIQQ